MNRKYLDEVRADKAFYSLEDQDPSEDRTKRYIKQREMYGFDDRETWAMEYSFVMWLYERLSMYNEIASQVIDTNMHTIKINKKIITQQQSIDEMLELCKTLLTYKGNMTDHNNGQSFERLLKLFKKTIYFLWW